MSKIVERQLKLNLVLASDEQHSSDSVLCYEICLIISLSACRFLYGNRNAELSLRMLLVLILASFNVLEFLKLHLFKYYFL